MVQELGVKAETDPSIVLLDFSKQALNRNG